MIRLLLRVAFLTPLLWNAACTATRSTTEPQLEPSPTAAAREGPDIAAETRAPLLQPPSGTGVLALTPGPIVISQACLDGIGSPESRARLERAPSPASTPQPYEPLPLDQDDALLAELLEILGDEAGSYAFVIKDLAGGRGAQHNADQIFYAASVFKLFVMFEVFNQQSQGGLDWTDELEITPYYDSFALSPRSTALCQVLSVAEAMDTMLRVSDNAAAVLLQDLAGAPNVNRSITALGVTQSGLFTDGLPLTAEDVALLLEAIARGAAVSRDASSDMLQLMTYEQWSNGLKEGLPADTIVAHKTGNWSDATHDAGIVFAPFGPYLFVVLSDRSHETRLIQALSRAAYVYFERR